MAHRVFGAIGTGEFTEDVALGISTEALSKLYHTPIKGGYRDGGFVYGLGSRKFLEAYSGDRLNLFMMAVVAADEIAVGLLLRHHPSYDIALKSSKGKSLLSMVPKGKNNDAIRSLLNPDQSLQDKLAAWAADNDEIQRMEAEKVRVRRIRDANLGFLKAHQSRSKSDLITSLAPTPGTDMEKYHEQVRKMVRNAKSEYASGGSGSYSSSSASLCWNRGAFIMHTSDYDSDRSSSASSHLVYASLPRGSDKLKTTSLCRANYSSNNDAPYCGSSLRAIKDIPGSFRYCKMGSSVSTETRYHLVPLDEVTLSGAFAASAATQAAFISFLATALKWPRWLATNIAAMLYPTPMLVPIFVLLSDDGKIISTTVDDDDVETRKERCMLDFLVEYDNNSKGAI